MRKNTSLFSRTPRGFADERLDCCVRALSVASGADYAAVHAHMDAIGRPRRRRTPWRIFTYAASAFGFSVMMETNPMTLAQFIRAHRQGVFVLATSRHAFVLIDGTVHDWKRGAGARSRIVRYYFKKG